MFILILITAVLVMTTQATKLSVMRHVVLWRSRPSSFVGHNLALKTNQGGVTSNLIYRLRPRWDLKAPDWRHRLHPSKLGPAIGSSRNHHGL